MYAQKTSMNRSNCIVMLLALRKVSASSAMWSVYFFKVFEHSLFYRIYSSIKIIPNDRFTVSAYAITLFAFNRDRYLLDGNQYDIVDTQTQKID